MAEKYKAKAETETQGQLVLPDKAANPLRIKPPEGQMMTIVKSNKDGALDKLGTIVRRQLYHILYEIARTIPHPDSLASIALKFTSLRSRFIYPGCSACSIKGYVHMYWHRLNNFYNLVMIVNNMKKINIFRFNSASSKYFSFHKFF